MMMAFETYENWLLLSEFVRPCAGQRVMLFRQVGSRRWRVSPVVSMPAVVDWGRWPGWRVVM
jgi:hypothetical protein